MKDMLPEYCNDLTVTDITRFSDLQVWFFASSGNAGARVIFFLGGGVLRYVSAGFKSC